MKVLITATSFSEVSREPEERLRPAGYEIVHNPYGRPMTAEEMRPLLKGIDAVAAGVDQCSPPAFDDADQPEGRRPPWRGHGLRRHGRVHPPRHRRSEHPGRQRGGGGRHGAGADAGGRPTHPDGDSTTKAGKWENSYGVDIFQATLGLLGLGRIGKGVARRCHGFDMRVLAYDPYFDEKFAADYGIERADSIEQVMREADFVSVHMPLSDETRKFINAEKIALMKPTAILVNTARGAIIDEDALADALEAGSIFGAGLDVYATEPPTHSRLLKCQRAVTMPHDSSNTPGALLAMGNGVVDAIIAVFDGQRPEFFVNPEVYQSK